MGRISERTANTVGVLACAALVLCLSIGFWHAPWSLVYMTSLAEMAAVGLLIAASVQNSWVSSMLSAPPLVGIGMISYGVYLWHYPAAVLLQRAASLEPDRADRYGFSVTAAAISNVTI